MDIGTKIKNAREDKELTQTEIAAMIPMNQSNYSKIERNNQEPSLYQLKRIAEILELDLNSLLDVTVNYEKKRKDELFLKRLKDIYNDIYIKK